MQAEPVGQFGDHRDVGEDSAPGRAVFAGDAYRVGASGANMDSTGFVDPIRLKKHGFPRDCVQQLFSPAAL